MGGEPRLPPPRPLGPGQEQGARRFAGDGLDNLFGGGRGAEKFSGPGLVSVRPRANAFRTTTPAHSFGLGLGAASIVQAVLPEGWFQEKRWANGRAWWSAYLARGSAQQAFVCVSIAGHAHSIRSSCTVISAFHHPMLRSRSCFHRAPLPFCRREHSSCSVRRTWRNSDWPTRRPFPRAAGRRWTRGRWGSPPPPARPKRLRRSQVGAA